MTFQQLEYLLAVYRNRSVTTASKELFVAPSSISISIGKMEKELGYPLFSRTQKGLIPTKRGEKVLEYADRICQTYHLLNQIEPETKKTICINTPGSKPAARAFAALVKEYMGQKDISFKQTSYSGDDLQSKLLYNEVAISIAQVLNSAVGYWEVVAKQAKLHRSVLKIIPAVVCVGPGHPLYNEDIISPLQLKDHLIVDGLQRPITRGILFRGAVPVTPDHILYADSPAARQELVNQGLAYYITKKPLECDLPDRKCHYIPLEGVSYHITATRSQHPVSPEISRFLALLNKELEAY